MRPVVGYALAIRATALAKKAMETTMQMATKAESDARTAAAQAAQAQRDAAASSTAAAQAGTGAATASSVAKDLQTALTAADGTHTDFDRRIKAIESAAPSSRIIGLGVGQLSAALLLNASADVVVMLSRTMPDMSYTLELPKLPGSTLTEKSRTTTSVTITVKAAVALAVGYQFPIAAWK